MPEYHIYCVDGGGRIVSRQYADVLDDAAALDVGRDLCDPFEVEVWERARLVARLAKNGTVSPKKPEQQSDQG